MFLFLAEGESVIKKSSSGNVAEKQIWIINCKLSNTSHKVVGATSSEGF